MSDSNIFWNFNLKPKTTLIKPRPSVSYEKSTALMLKLLRHKKTKNIVTILQFLSNKNKYIF